MAVRKSRIFLSYARKDAEFAKELLAGLREPDEFEILIDVTGISYGEGWKARIGQLIRQCDTMVFVISPDSLASDVCRWEIEQADKLSKRILPLLWRPVSFANAPAAISRINALPFDGANAVTGLAKLRTALAQDLNWLRANTVLLEQAATWDAQGRKPEHLLRGSVRDDAETLLNDRPTSAPEPTPLQRAYLSASAAEEARLKSEEQRRLEELERAKAAAERARSEAVAERDAAETARALAAKRAAEAATQAQRARRALVAALIFLTASLAGGGAAWVNYQDALVATDRAETALFDAQQSALSLELALMESVMGVDYVEEGLNFVVRFETASKSFYERRLSKPNWPGGASGVTIGIGYDLGLTDQETIYEILKGRLKEEQILILSEAAGVRGDAARSLAAREDFQSIEISWETAQAIFRETMLLEFMRRTQRRFPRMREIHFACQIALISLVINRGDRLDGEGRRHMRRINDAIAARQPRRIPIHLRDMTQIWEGRGLDGLRQRREAEARLCEIGLEARQRARKILADHETLD